MKQTLQGRHLSEDQQESCASLYERYFRYVHFLARKQFRDPEAVQDLVHDVLGIAVPEAILRRAFPPSEPQQVALLKLMVRRRANHLRRHWRVGLAEPREQGGDPDRRLEQLAAKHADSDEVTLLECWFDFEASLRTLPAKQREVLILKEVYGKSCEEVAVAVGIAPSSIGKYVSEAKKSLTEMREVKDDV